MILNIPLDKWEIYGKIDLQNKKGSNTMTKVEKLEAFIKELWPNVETEINGTEDFPCLMIYGTLVSNNLDEQKSFPIDFIIWEDGKVETAADIYPVGDPVGPYYVNGDEAYPKQTLMINPEVLYF